MKKYIYAIIIASVIFLVLILIFDLFNVTQYLALSNQCDWLNFLGTYIGAILGSLVTLVGVQQTIQYEKEKDIEKNKLSHKPYFYKIDFEGKYDPREMYEFILSEDASYNNKAKSKEIAIIKNTDNAILIVDHIAIDEVEYFPALGEVIDKNQTVCLEIFSNNDIKLGNIKFYIKDILGNTYEYLFIYDAKEEKIVQLKEIINHK